MNTPVFVLFVAIVIGAAIAVVFWLDNAITDSKRNNIPSTAKITLANDITLPVHGEQRGFVATNIIEWQNGRLEFDADGRHYSYRGTYLIEYPTEAK